MARRLGVLVTMALLAAPPALAQRVYKCTSPGGGVSYQQTACAEKDQAQSIRQYREPPPASTKAPVNEARSFTEAPHSPNAYRAAAQTYSPPASPPRTVQAAPTDHVRCTRPNGTSYVRKGSTCPDSRVPIPHQAGMVLDVTTGQQHFMVPGGGNAMIDPSTGNRHELISPPPTRRVPQTAQRITRDEACAEERARRDAAMSNFRRTMDSMRAARARYERLCGK